MKSILYVGATLMIGASVYGFVDLQKTSHNKEFKNMYEDQKTTNVVTTDEKSTEPAVKKEIAASDKKVATKEKAVKEGTATISIKPISADEKIATTEVKTIENSTVDVKTSVDNDVTKKVKKKKRLDARLFSRAPLREEEDIKPEPVKTEVKKTGEKEQ